MKSVKADNRRKFVSGIFLWQIHSSSETVESSNLLYLHVYTLMKLGMLKLHGGYLSFSLHEFLCIWNIFTFLVDITVFFCPFFVYVESFVPMQVAAIFWMHIIWIHTIKKLVKILWTSYRNGPIITSKNLIEKYKSNKMIMKYKSWIYILQNTWIFFF